ncbi:hypothetical protein ABZ070_36485 [Streptomyces sp. NPDC006283]|uniref:hypothetical protein n=1 Tax=Streptomyces sp. NPDC006283 TaxID=3156741 RepID=UPI0033A311A6
MLAEELKVGDVGLEFLTGKLKGSHDPSGTVFTVLAALGPRPVSLGIQRPPQAAPIRPAPA